MFVFRLFYHVQMHVFLWFLWMNAFEFYNKKLKLDRWVFILGSTQYFITLEGHFVSQSSREKLDNNFFSVSLMSKQLIFFDLWFKDSCDDGETCCKLASEGFGCCPMEEAVCCSDGQHCCPHGTTCDLEHLACVKQTVGLTQEFRSKIHFQTT